MTEKSRTHLHNEARRQQLKHGLKIRRDTYGEILRLLKQAERDILATLAGTATEYEQFYLPQLLQQVRAVMAELGEQSAGVLSQSANSAWQAGIDLVDKPLAAGGVQLSGIVPQIDSGQLVAMRTFMVDRIKDVPAALAEKISAQLGLTMIGSQSMGDTVSNIQRLFKTQGRSRALTIVRTELGRAYAVATQARMTEAQKVLPGLKKQWRRSGKIHSRANHDAIDGQIREVDEPFQLANGVELMQPRDPRAPAAETINCGCEELPWMEHWEVSNPDRKPYSEIERQLNPRQAALSPAVQPRSPMEGAAYQTALRPDGLNAGMLSRYRQLRPAKIEKAIRSIEKQVTLHQTGINDPTRKVPGFYQLSADKQRHLVERTWPNDIKRQRDQIEVLRGLLEEKKQ